jgi:hypothetical protein
MTQDFPCKEMGCDQKVHYTRETIPALGTAPFAREAKEIVVYLKCAKGHLHAYTVKGGKFGKT